MTWAMITSMERIFFLICVAFPHTPYPLHSISSVNPDAQYFAGSHYNHFSALQPSGLMGSMEKSIALMFDAATNGRQMNSDPTHRGTRRTPPNLSVGVIPHSSAQQRPFSGPHDSGGQRPGGGTCPADPGGSSRGGTASGGRPWGRHSSSMSGGAWRRSQFGCEMCGVFCENAQQLEEHLKSKKHSAKEAK